MIKFGWRKDRPDRRDYSAMQLLERVVPVPDKYMVDAIPLIQNQGETPSCVGFATAGSKTEQEFLQYKKHYKFDGLWLYKECKKIDGYPCEDGTEPRVALKIVKERGIKRTGLFYFFPSKKWDIAGYYRIEPGTGEHAIKQIIFQFGTIIVGSNWYYSWMDKFSVFPAPNSVAGGHAYRIVGWNDIGYVVANSWGTELWGEGGLATMPYDMFRRVLAEGDVWKLVDDTTA